MLPRQFSLKNQADFSRIRRAGRRLSSANLTCYFLPSAAAEPRFGVVVSGKVAGSAVTRNRIRREILASLARAVEDWAKREVGDMVVVVMKKPDDIKELSEEIKLCLNKLSSP